MDLLVVVVNDDDFEKVMTLFVEMGIGGATVIESKGMGQVISHEIPIFATLRSLVHEACAHNKTIFAVIRKKKILKDTIESLENIIDFEKPGGGILFVVPITEAFGLTDGVWSR
ncbi:MAG: P-II family nitrogen regulator [Thermodesulfobacteriota bacterium]